MKKILFIAPIPSRPELRLRQIQNASLLKLPFFKAKSFMAPLQIGTIAALTPDEFEVDLWDESLHGCIDDATKLKDYDLVGITGFSVHLTRARAISQLFRKRGAPVVIGGAGVSVAPQLYRNDFDVLFIGEAELTWPQFLADWKSGNYRSEYRQVAKIDLSLSPPPRWDSIAGQMQYYFAGPVQTSRGCPFNCEFCAVSYLLGRRFRYKPIERVLEEVANLEKLGMLHVIFCDDNFIGNPRYSKELLRELISLNNSFQRPLQFGTELSINVADDEDLLELLADANFTEISIGIETPNKESLKETHKLQNYRRDLVNDIKKIESYGLSIQGSLVVGFDHDSKEIFDQQFQFLQEACITIPAIRVLIAPLGTQLWKRLLGEGRLIKTDEEFRYLGDPGTTNIITKGMTRLELLSGYLDLIKRIYNWNNFAVRIKGFVSNIRRKPNTLRDERHWKAVFQFIYFLFVSLDRKTRRVVLDILQYTRQQAPFMVPRVVGIILHQYGFAARKELLEAIQSQIDQERSGTSKLEIEQANSSIVSIPERFEKFYEKVFPEIYKKVYSNTADEAYAEELLVEIFTEFVTRHGVMLDSFSEEHSNFLVNIADRIIAEKIGSKTEELVSAVSITETQSVLSPDDQDLSDFKQNCLSDEVLKAVEQEIQIHGSYLNDSIGK